jgi:MFS family permease
MAAPDGSGNPIAQTRSSRTATLADIRSVLTIPSLLALMSAFACANFVAMVLLAWMPMYLYSKFHLTLEMAAFDAAVYPQAASIAGSFFGGYLADTWAKRTIQGRVRVQCAGVLAGAPFVALCGLGHSLSLIIVALVGWGFFKGIYDSNIFAAAFDVVPAEHRGVASGSMNCVGWLLGAGTAPVLIGYLAEHISLGTAIALSATIYWVAAILLVVAMACFLESDIRRLRLGKIGLKQSTAE